MVTSVGVRAAVRAAVIAYGAAASLPTLALGLGEIEMQSFLNEPLRAEVELLDTRQLTVDDIRIRLAGVDDFDRLGVERSYFLTSINFDIQIDETTGRGIIRLSTDEAVLEPFIDLIIEARWPSGRLLREYTVLVDPPAFRQDVVTVSAVERVQQTSDLEKPAVSDASGGQEKAATGAQGDSVSLRQSSLPAGQMPERAFSAETSEIPRSGNRYMVKRDETLWQIASAGKPQGVSVQQAMLEIQRLNPEAFINGNINQIKAGYIVYLPAAGEVNSDDLSRALDEVREQNQEWRAGRGAPGVTAAATLRVSTDSGADTQSRRSDTEAVSSAPSSDNNTGQPASSGSTPTSVTDAPAADMNELAPAGESAGSSELAAQLDAMATRLDTLEQIVSLKDEQIATLEQALREAREAAAMAASAPAPVAPVTRPAPSPAPVVSAPQSQSGGIPWLPISGGALALIAAVLLFLRRRTKDQDADPNTQLAAEDEDVFAGVNLTKESFDDDSSEQVDEESVAVKATDEDTEAVEKPTVTESVEEDVERLSRGGSRGYGERKHDDYIDEGSAGDALAEADIYIAYGRYLQAIELLDTAISSDPDNSAYRVKLIELYVDMGEETSAAEQLEELRKHGSPDAISRGEALLGGGIAVAPGFASEASDELPVIANESDGDQDLELTSEDSESVDLSDGLDLGFGDADAGDAFDGAASEIDGGEPIEFEHLEIEEDIPLAGDDDLDFSSANDELDLSDALVMAEDNENSDVVAPGASDTDNEELLIADDADQMATKLDLARAYIDMGDSEGARGILEEVIEKGTQEQQQESRDLLTRIA